MSWLIYALLAGILFSGYNTFVSLSSRHFTPTLILLIVTGTAFLISLIINGYLSFHSSTPKINLAQIYQPILGGVFNSLAIICYSLVFSQKSSLFSSSSVVSIILNCSLMFISLIILGEKITFLKASSLLLSLATITYIIKG